MEFTSLQAICTDWPRTAVPDGPWVDGTLERLRQIVAGIQSRAQHSSAADLIPLVRQALLRRSFSGASRHLRVPLAVGWPSAHHWRSSGFTVAQDMGTSCLITAHPPRLEWLGEGHDLLDDAFSLIKTRKDFRVPLDPFMERATGYTHYTCTGQREAVRALFALPEADVLIANLPTGSGKSILAQANALVNVGDGYLTLVIVPTVSLAIDQARRMEALLRRRDPRWTPGPLAFHAGISQADRRHVRAAVRAGTQRIVFTSPESASDTLLADLEVAASNGYLRCIVVDEAHIVVAWGDAFRPEFQLLPGLIAHLTAKAAQPLRLVLTTATLTAPTLSVLKRIFGRSSHVEVVSAVHLRPEPHYWFVRAPDRAAQVRNILDAVEHAPRPYVLYVTKPDDADEWYSLLKRVGFQRVRTFHGRTPSNEREDVLRDWASNSIDGVVATSAFGLGVDKDDVRTVIHATLPESLDRFYQEAGRGGRDGRASVSLVVFTDDDRAAADFLAEQTLISAELAYEKWLRMIDNATVRPGYEGVFWVDLHAQHSGIVQTSAWNRDWNLRTLTLMVRADLIDIVALDATRRVGAEGRDLTSVAEYVGVHLRAGSHRDKEFFLSAIRLARLASKAATRRALEVMASVADGRSEVADALKATYTLTAPGSFAAVNSCCGGCPVHWGASADFVRDYSAPQAPRLQRYAPRSRSAVHRLFVKAEPLMVSVPSSARYASEVAELASALMTELRPHTIAVGPTCSPGLRSRVLGLVANGVEPVFVDTLADISHGAPGGDSEVRIVVLETERDLEMLRAAWSSGCAYQVIVFPEDFPDPQHPLRRLVDTVAHVPHTVLMNKITE